MGMLSTHIAQATGYTEDEVKTILLKKMNREAKPYRSSLKAHAIEPESWAGITTCYCTSDPAVYIKEVGKKK